MYNYYNNWYCQNKINKKMNLKMIIIYINLQIICICSYKKFFFINFIRRYAMEKFILPKNIQIKMIEFFYKTSIPRILKENNHESKY